MADVSGELSPARNRVLGEINTEREQLFMNLGTISERVRE